VHPENVLLVAHLFPTSSCLLIRKLHGAMLKSRAGYPQIILVDVKPVEQPLSVFSTSDPCSTSGVRGRMQKLHSTIAKVLSANAEIDLGYRSRATRHRAPIYYLHKFVILW
jgi:hypothetical protein